MADEQHGSTETLEVPEVAQGFINDLESRMTELRPQVTEYNALNDMRSRVLGLDQHAPAPATRSRGRRRSSGGGGETAADGFLRVVSEHPEGVTVSEVAKALEVQPNYLYRVAANLTEEGKTEKKDNKYFLAPASSASSGTSGGRGRRSR